MCIKRKEHINKPEMVDRLYLHHKGFAEIENLEKFTQLTDLFLEGNELTTIDKLNAQTHLQVLQLQKNKLQRIENLDGCLALKYLDVSENLISKIDDLSKIQNLESLIVRRNLLDKPDSIRNIIYMKRLRELDLSKNKINCSIEAILEILSKCKSLKILTLKGNPIAKSTKHYRKLVVSRCQKLTHLDGSPICKEERLRCNSWGKVVMNGGSYDEADKADREKLNKIRSDICASNNAQKRAKDGHHGSDDGSLTSNNSKTIGGSAIEAMKRTFGLVDSRAPSSNIAWSSQRNLDLSLRKELEEARGIVESQRKEITHLKEQIEEKQSKLETEQMMSSSSCTDDSEKETSYSLKQNQKLAQKAARHVPQMPSATEIATEQSNRQNSNSHSSSMAAIGVQDVDPFSILPPIPPPRNTT